jgi:PIN domain nuclease of toxin-antitoxin system
MSKEFGIISGSTEKLIAKAPMLVAGDIDVLYKIAVKTHEFNDLRSIDSFASVSAQSPLKASSNSSLADSKRTVGSNNNGSYHKVFLASGSVKKVFKTSVTSLMTFPQFTVVMKHFALKLYANMIEHQLGTALEFLPSIKKEQATQMAIEMFIKEKVMNALYLCGHVCVSLFIFLTRPLYRFYLSQISWDCCRGHSYILSEH